MSGWSRLVSILLHARVALMAVPICVLWLIALQRVVTMALPLPVASRFSVRWLMIYALLINILVEEAVVRIWIIIRWASVVLGVRHGVVFLALGAVVQVLIGFLRLVVVFMLRF